MGRRAVDFGSIQSPGSEGTALENQEVGEIRIIIVEFDKGLIERVLKIETMLILSWVCAFASVSFFIPKMARKPKIK